MKEQKTFLSNLSLWKPVKWWWMLQLYVLWNLLLPTYKDTLQARYFFFWYYPNCKYIKNILAAKINSAQTLPMTDWDFSQSFTNYLIPYFSSSFTHQVKIFSAVRTDVHGSQWDESHGPEKTGRCGW